MKNLLFVLFVALSFTIISCGDGSGAASVNSTPISEVVKPVAAFLNATSGVQLSSYFSSENYKEETVTISGKACMTGSYGKKPAIGMCVVEVEGMKIKPHFLVSQEDKDKLSAALKKAETESKGEIESLDIVIEGKLVKEGSQKSPFGEELDLRFAEGKIIQIKE